MKKTISVFFLLIGLQVSAQILLSPEVDSIPMRDGKMLAADIYLPDTVNQYPVILIQTPYNRLLFRAGLPLKVGKDLKNSAYAFVIVDWRCFYGSADACILTPDRGKDGYDVIEWITQQAWSDGKVGTWGPSALGKIQYMTAREQHPNHICAVPMVAGSQFEYKEYFPNGVLRTEYVDQLDALGYNMKNALLQHPYYDAYWQYIENANMYPDKIKTPMLLIGGWFDHNIGMMFRLFDTLVKASDTSVRDKHKFLVGPWSHNSVGKKKVGDLEFADAEGKHDSFALLFFDYWLRSARNGWPHNERYLLYEANGYQNPIRLNDLNSAPYANKVLTKYLYFSYGRGHFSIAISPDVIYREFTYDPKDPSPTIGGPTLRTDLKQGPVDISELVYSRQDNIKFQLHGNSGIKGIYIHGSPVVELFVSSDKLDTDFNLRLYFYPEPWDTSKLYILCDGVYRMRFRDGFSAADEKMMHKDSVYKISITLPPLFVLIPQFGSLGLMISSSNYPRYDLNLNNGGDLYKAGDSLTAKNRVWMGGQYPSKISFPGLIYVGIKETEETSVNLFPNPVQSRLFINVEQLYHPFTYTLTDLQGREILKGAGKDGNTFSLDLSGLQPQLYLLRISNEKHSVVRKVVKVE